MLIEIVKFLFIIILTILISFIIDQFTDTFDSQFPGTSFSNINEKNLLLNVTQFNLNLSINYKYHILEGYIDIFLTKKSGEKFSYQSYVIFDTYNLDIKSVQIRKKNSSSENIDYLNFFMMNYSKVYGLDIPKEMGMGLFIKVDLRQFHEVVYIEGNYLRIYYKTKNESKNFIWDNENEIMYIKTKYAFSRSFFPFCDYPGIRSKWNAVIRDSKNNSIIMPGKIEKIEYQNNEKIVYFKQDNPVPSYLVSLTFGKFDEIVIGNMTKVYYPSNYLNVDQIKFPNYTKILQYIELIEEELPFKYRWGEFNFVLIPDYKGIMEYPCYVHMNLEKEINEKLIIHQLILSFIGNVISPKTWEHIWVSESLSVYFERFIIFPKMFTEIEINELIEKEYGTEYFIKNGLEKFVTLILPLYWVYDERLYENEMFEAIRIEKGVSNLMRVFDLSNSVDDLEDVIDETEMTTRATTLRLVKEFFYLMLKKEIVSPMDSSDFVVEVVTYFTNKVSPDDEEEVENPFQYISS